MTYGEKPQLLLLAATIIYGQQCCQCHCTPERCSFHLSKQWSFIQVAHSKVGPSPGRHQDCPRPCDPRVEAHHLFRLSYEEGDSLQRFCHRAVRCRRCCRRVFHWNSDINDAVQGQRTYGCGHVWGYESLDAWFLVKIVMMGFDILWCFCLPNAGIFALAYYPPSANRFA